MDLKELCSLMEAYSEVYAPQEVNELYKGKHGQTEKEYQDSRSHGGKMISGDSKSSGAAWSHRSYKGVGKPAKPGERQANQGKMDRGTRADIEYRKANLKKEELDIFDVVLEFLQTEGYAETLEEAEWMMANELDAEDIANIIDEAVKGESSDRRRALAAERRRGIKPLSAKEGEKYASHKISQMAYTKRAKMGDDD